MGDPHCSAVMSIGKCTNISLGNGGGIHSLVLRQDR